MTKCACAEAGAGKTGQQEHADCEDSAERLGPSRSGPDTKIQLLRVSLNTQDSWEKQAAAAVALTSFVQVQLSLLPCMPCFVLIH